MNFSCVLILRNGKRHISLWWGRTEERDKVREEYVLLLLISIFRLQIVILFLETSTLKR